MFQRTYAQSLLSSDSSQILKALHGEVPHRLQLLIDDLKSDFYSLADVVGFAFLYPPLFYPVIEFLRSFRHKVGGWVGEWVSDVLTSL